VRTGSLNKAVCAASVLRLCCVFKGLRLIHTCHAVPLAICAALIHTYHAVPLPLSDSAVPFVKVRVVAGNIRTASPTVQRIGMLLITTFVGLFMVRSRTRADRPHDISGWLMLIHACHAMAMPRCALALRGRFQKGMIMAWHGPSKACVNQTRPHCVNQMGKTQFKPLAERHGRGTAC
jgi:hypothetical protein